MFFFFHYFNRDGFQNYIDDKFENCLEINIFNELLYYLFIYYNISISYIIKYVLLGKANDTETYILMCR